MLFVNRAATDHQLLSQRLDFFYHEQWRSDRASSSRSEYLPARSSVLSQALLKQKLSRLPFLGRQLRRFSRLWRLLISADTRLRDKLMALPILGHLGMWLWGILRFSHFKYETLAVIRQLDSQLTALQAELKSTNKQMVLQAREIQKLRALIENRTDNTPSV